MRRQAAVIARLRQAQAAEERRRDVRDAELMKQNAVLLAKLLELKLLVKDDGLVAKSAWEEHLVALDCLEQAIANLKEFSAYLMEDIGALRRQFSGGLPPRMRDPPTVRFLVSNNFSSKELPPPHSPARRRFHRLTASPSSRPRRAPGFGPAACG